MYIIVSYDVNACRCNKVNKILKKYLFNIHNSVFEGELTNKQYLNLKNELYKTIHFDEDRVIFYLMLSNKYIRKEYMGEKVEINCLY
ncbi:MAG TPA: CRISPR-associated endonuclease Cas2 [Acholeplasmataceae bacterium]|jgi:CRISPR-associated protein Cas2|nr:CRISPR-associated endonuclease Cas2 [Acholeplasmataceae bacterium]